MRTQTYTSFLKIKILKQLCCTLSNYKNVRRMKMIIGITIAVAVGVVIASYIQKALNKTATA